MFTCRLKWIFLKNSNKGTVETIFNNLDVMVDSDITLMTQNGNAIVSIEKLYKVQNGEPIVLENIGYWTKKLGFVASGTSESLVRRRNDLLGIELSVCIVITHNDSLNHLTDKR